MNKLRIPEVAYTAGANAYDEADPDSRWLEAIDAAAPLIVAAELRRLFQENPTALWLLRRANSLDPQGVTK